MMSFVTQARDDVTDSHIHPRCHPSGMLPVPRAEFGHEGSQSLGVQQDTPKTWGENQIHPWCLVRASSPLSPAGDIRDAASSRAGDSRFWGAACSPSFQPKFPPPSTAAEQGGTGREGTVSPRVPLAQGEYGRER